MLIKINPITYSKYIKKVEIPCFIDDFFYKFYRPNKFTH